MSKNIHIQKGIIIFKKNVMDRCWMDIMDINYGAQLGVSLQRPLSRFLVTFL